VRFTFFDFPLSKIFRLLGFLQRDLQFLISRCHKSSVGTIFHSGIYIFLFPAVKIPLLAWYSTARFTIFDFPLFQAFFLPDFAKGATSINPNLQISNHPYKPRYTKPPRQNRTLDSSHTKTPVSHYYHYNG